MLLLTSYVYVFTCFLCYRARNAALSMSVQRKDEYVITLLPGDGIGPEIISATLPSLNAVASKHGFKFSFREADIGGYIIVIISFGL